MDYNIAFLVTTYNRPTSLIKLVTELKKYGKVFIIDDGSDNPVKIEGVEYKLKPHGGKVKFAETITELWQMIKGKDFDYYFMIQDDVMPLDGFVDDAIRIWQSIVFDNKITLNIFTEKSRYMKPCWTGFNPIHYGEFLHTQWVDCMFMCEKKFFEIFNYTTLQPKRDYIKNPQLGSGVGSYLSATLNDMGLGMFQTAKSLLITQPEGYTSKMNPHQNNDLIYQIV